MAASNFSSNQSPPHSGKYPPDPSAGSSTPNVTLHVPDLVGYVIGDSDSDADADHLVPTNPSTSASANPDQTVALVPSHPPHQEELCIPSDSPFMAAANSSTNQSPPDRSNHSADLFACSSTIRMPDLERYVITDSDSDSEVDALFPTNPSKSGSANPDQRVAQAHSHLPIQELCTSNFCGVSCFLHPIGPYHHHYKSSLAVFPGFKLVSRLAPWGVGNPPPEVWDAWVNTFPLHAGSRPKDLWGSRELYQRDVDLVNGFVAYHGWIPDENVDPAARRQFNPWCEKWRREREQGIVRLKVVEEDW